jgi:hypothetical protein
MQQGFVCNKDYIILFPRIIDKSPDSSNELIQIIFYTKVCNVRNAKKDCHQQQYNQQTYTKHETIKNKK